MVDKDTLRKFYQTNADFKRYVDACVTTYGHDVDYALESPIIQEYYKSLQKGGCNERHREKDS